MNNILTIHNENGRISFTSDIDENMSYETTDFNKFLDVVNMALVDLRRNDVITLDGDDDDDDE